MREGTGKIRFGSPFCVFDRLPDLAEKIELFAWLYFSFRFCKLGSEILIIIFGRKNGLLFCFVCFDCLFVAILCPILAHFFLKTLLKGTILRSGE